MNELEVLCGSRSNAGRQRENNEDRVVCHVDRGVFAVIDGVGGEVGGEKAAAIAEEHLLLRLSRPTGTTEQLLEQAIVLANREILAQASADPRLKGMSCVLTVVVLEPAGSGVEAVCAHVGDTRLYRLFPRGIEKLTRDHSLVGELEDRRELTEEEAMRHPRRNEILRDVGSDEHELGDPDFVDVKRFPFRPNEALLLCSDGLSDQVDSQQIRATVEQHARDPQKAVDRLIAAANEAGGKDNVSAVLVVGPEYGRAPAPPPPDGMQGSSAPAKTQVGVAAQASSRWGALGRRLRSRRPWYLLLAALALLALSWVWPRVLAAWIEAKITAKLPPLARSLEVGPDAPYETIAAALDTARPGDRVRVAPGTYRETVRLRDRVSLASSRPGGAVLAPAAGAEAVLAEGVQEAVFEGFRIELPPEVPIGIRLVGSALVVRGVEIQGARSAAVSATGEDRSTVERSFLHANPGAALWLAEGSAPWFVDNVVLDSGVHDISVHDTGGGADRFAIEAQNDAVLRLRGNTFAASGSPVICALTAGDPAELFLGNRFGDLPQEKAVHLGAAVCGPPGL